MTRPGIEARSPVPLVNTLLIRPIAGIKGSIPFPRGISQKVNAIVPLKFEFAVQHISHYAPSVIIVFQEILLRIEPGRIGPTKYNYLISILSLGHTFFRSPCLRNKIQTFNRTSLFCFLPSTRQSLSVFSFGSLDQIANTLAVRILIL